MNFWRDVSVRGQQLCKIYAGDATQKGKLPRENALLNQFPAPPAKWKILAKLVWQGICLILPSLVGSKGVSNVERICRKICVKFGRWKRRFQTKREISKFNFKAAIKPKWLGLAVFYERLTLVYQSSMSGLCWTDHLVLSCGGGRHHETHHQQGKMLTVAKKIWVTVMAVCLANHVRVGGGKSW